MNFSTLNEMIRQGDMSLNALKYLIQCRTECENLDYKIDLHLDIDLELCEFARDVLAIKNVGGGYIVIGVKDKTWEPVGIQTALPYDTKLIRDKIRKASGIDLDIYLVGQEIDYGGQRRIFGLVYIRSTRKRSKLRVPTMASKNFSLGNKHEIRIGDIYIRKGDETRKLSSEAELEHILDSLAEREQAETATGNDTNQYAVHEGLYRLLDKGFDRFIGRERYKLDLIAKLQGDPRIWIINVYGPGGVGKSSLVNWAIYEMYNQRQYESIVHLTAKETMLTEKGIKSCLRNLYSLEDLVDSILTIFEEASDADIEIKVQTAYQVLMAYKVLLVLDNMETIDDARILSFVQNIPFGSPSKVLITSRTKTGGWELPFPLSELSLEETKEFVTIKSIERKIDFPLDESTIRDVHKYTGGLPLAIQWTIGQFSRGRDTKAIFKTAIDPNSPILEFSFRNIWNLLSNEALQTFVWS